MKTKVKTLPLVMTILSAMYLVYVASSEDTTLVADAVGGDPGGKLLPMIIAVFLFLGFLYITIKEKPTGEKMDKRTFVLFLITFALAVCYVLFTKVLGFVILSTIVLYTLEYLYSTIDEKRKPLSAILGGLATLALASGFYTIMRLITKTIGRMARKGALPPIFSSGSLNAVISLVFVILSFVLLYFALYKPLKKIGYGHVANAGLISFTVVLILFIVFKQFFLVGLAPGLLNF